MFDDVFFGLRGEGIQSRMLHTIIYGCDVG